MPPARPATLPLRPSRTPPRRPPATRLPRSRPAPPPRRPPRPPRPPPRPPATRLPRSRPAPPPRRPPRPPRPPPARDAAAAVEAGTATAEAAQAAEAAAQAARDAAAAVEAGTATAEAAQAAIDAAAEAAAAAAAAAGEASAAAGAAAATAQETAEAAAETAAAAVAAAEEAADAAREAAEAAAMAMEEDEPATGETDFNATVRIGVADASGGLDFLGPSAGGAHNVVRYDSLMQYDQLDVGSGIQPNAGAFEYVTDDATEAVFHVKPGMTVHDGAPVTAADIKFSIDRTSGIAPYNPDGTFPSPFTYQTGPVAGEITVPDELTVHLPMTPDATAFDMARTLQVFPKHIIEEIGDEAYNNTGEASGPFKLEEYVPGDIVRHSRYEGYHVEAGSTHRQHKPWMKELQQIVRPEPLSIVAALEADEMDMTLSLPVDLAESFLDSDDFDVLYVQGSGGNPAWNFEFNTLRPLPDGSTPFQDVRVRRAMNHAFNFDAFRESLTGKEERSYGIASAEIGAMAEEQKAALTYEYNPEKARALLAESRLPLHFPCHDRHNLDHDGRFDEIFTGCHGVCHIPCVRITTRTSSPDAVRLDDLRYPENPMRGRSRRRRLARTPPPIPRTPASGPSSPGR